MNTYYTNNKGLVTGKEEKVIITMKKHVLQFQFPASHSMNLHTVNEY